MNNSPIWTNYTKAIPDHVIKLELLCSIKLHGQQQKGNDSASIKFHLNSTCELIPDKMIIVIQKPQSRT